jgi:hypothetical protein
MKKSILLTICLALFGHNAFALDLIELGKCMEYGDRSPEDNRYYCFPMMKDIADGEILYIIFFPFTILSENAPSNINTAQLTEMGYTSEEIADLRKDMKELQSAMAQRKTPFNSALEMKAWMQSFPLAPITLELMRRN